jgi:hypothetical protein
MDGQASDDGGEPGRVDRARPLRLAGLRRSRDGAAILAILVPGAGHAYAGRYRAAVIWLLAILLGYWAIFLPGAVLHAISVWSAHRAVDAGA